MSFFNNEHLGKLLLRIALGVTLLLHGIAKIGAPGVVDHIGGRLEHWSLPAPLAFGVFIGELIAPLMILAGWRCRIGGALAAVNMLFAIVLMRLGAVWSLSETGGWHIETEVLMLGAALALLFCGSGRMAIRPD
ncbi:DoxX family protein [Kushneria indalinina]|uniref:Putative oxidoreductase n=1 Tax=Kushneria indalinina DSM 14324 TaxID=1122140 RepID=A0A3D9DS69_9GAMM|nr:DoxX family protein [Kushneria indalinina]REC93556.1 putative oxidoreductase [Kushneria indalinina DSM 14324]